MPKSVTTMRPSSPTSTLSGLRSRCTTPRACAAPRPLQSSMPIDDGPLRRHPAFGDDARQRCARYVLHREVPDSAGLADVVHPGHAGVSHAPRETHFATEQIEPVARAELRPQDLERDLFVELADHAPDRLHPSRRSPGDVRSRSVRRRWCACARRHLQVDPRGSRALRGTGVMRDIGTQLKPRHGRCARAHVRAARGLAPRSMNRGMLAQPVEQGAAPVATRGR
jgi:hypothetical protein